MTTVYREKINFYKAKLEEYEGKLVTVGLSEKDRKNIIKILKLIHNDKIYYCPKEKFLSLKNEIEDVEGKLSKEIRFFNTESKYLIYYQHKEEFEDLEPYVQQIDNIESKLYEMVLLLYNKVHTITLREFILRNSILTHLVYTNNESSIIKPRSADSYMFLCQFHVERTPSMLVNNSSNFLHCFGCGTNLDSIEYLMQYENLTEKDAMSVLANIYCLNYPGKKSPIVELQDKYVNSLLSDDFKDLLERGYKRTQQKERSILVTKGINKFEQDFETIKRVTEGEVKDYKFEDKPKRFIKKN